MTNLGIVIDSNNDVLVSNNKALAFILPSDYTKMDYIASTGIQHIDTGVILTNNTLICEWEGRDDNTSGSTSLFSAEYVVGANNLRDFAGVLHGRNTGRALYIGRTTGMSVDYSSSDGLFHKWSLNISPDHTVYLVKDGTKLTTYNWTGNLDVYNSIALFCNHTTNSFSQKASVAYKYFRMKDEGGWLFWGIPARRNSDQVLGLYDLIHQRFFVNNGSGVFVADNNYLTFGTTNANIVERCDYNMINGGTGVVVNATSTYGRASFTFPVVANGTQYQIDFDATAEDGYKRIYFHNAALNPGDGWDPVYGTVDISAGGHFTKTITSSSNVLWIGIYASAPTTTGKITLKNVTVTQIYTSGCCISEDTPINYYDGTVKLAKEVQVGDKLIGYNETTGEFEEVEVLQVRTPIRDSMIRVTLDDDSYIDITPDHPLYTKDGWQGYDLEAARENYKHDIFTGITQLTTGSKLLYMDGTYKGIKSIKELVLNSDKVKVYTFNTTNGVDTYISNGLVSHNHDG